jgi:nitroimidazol reductase NimA-like FMN-containing flavoprotein (pyridoxamine 5'-phosphate oxidase superfamily)
MRTIDDRTGLEVLGENECLLLLGRTAVGRLIVVDDGRALVFPVNYRRDGRTVVLRTDEGLKLGLMADGSPVTFEVDELDGAGRAGWSVVVTGVASEVTDEGELAALARLQLHPWAPGAKSRYVRIVPERLEGRRIVRREDAHYRREA